MKRRAVIFLLVAIVIATFAAPVAAQENATTEAAPEEEESIVYVDDEVKVLDYSYDEDREMFAVSLENEGEATRQVTITEVIQARDEASGSMGVQMISLSPGERTVEVPVKKTDGSAAVMIVTQQSLERGEGTFLRVGDDLPSIFSGEATWGYVRIGGLGGAGGTIVLALLLGWHRVADSTDSVEVRL